MNTFDGHRGRDDDRARGTRDRGAAARGGRGDPHPHRAADVRRGRGERRAGRPADVGAPGPVGRAPLPLVAIALERGLLG
jgi:hypothetical protein